MKNHDIMLMAFLALALVFAGTMAVPVISAQIVNLTGITIVPPGNESEDSAGNILLEEAVQHMLETEELPSVPFEYSPSDKIDALFSSLVSSNGMTVEYGILTNNGNETIEAFAQTGGRQMNPVIEPGKAWVFAEVNNLVIFSDSSDMVIDPARTTYYNMNQWLKIGFSGDCRQTTIMVYTKDAPGRISSDISSHWSYDPEKQILYIMLKSCSEHELVVDWSAYPSGKGTLIIEDFTLYEDLNYLVEKLRTDVVSILSSVAELSEDVVNEQAKTAQLNKQINDTIEEKNTVAFGIVEKEKELEQKNASITGMVTRIEQSTLITPLQAVFVALLFFILVLYIAIFGIEKIGIFGLGEDQEEGEEDEQ